jgi:fumarylacetoacetase
MNAIPGLDETHDPARRSWVTGADEPADFPIQNLPFGVFSPPGQAPRGGVAIGASILDLSALAENGRLHGPAQQAARAAQAASLNALLALGCVPRQALRHAVSDLLRTGAPAEAQIAPMLHPISECTLHLPCAIGDYTDFYVGIHHARNIGLQFRPDQPLLPNYKHIPIGYHGRASSVRLSGAAVRRPNGQTKAPDAATPRFGPAARLDYELELGVWVGPGNAAGEPIPIAAAAGHIAGYCLLNDWSARDVQAWEYQPLGPFLSKSFATTISGWIVTPEALAPFRMAQPARPPGDPHPLPYLLDAADQSAGALDIELEVLLHTQGMRARGMAPHRLSRSSTRHMYWTPAQMLAHHASGGCDMRPGDLLGTGTLSGPEPGSFGSLLETSQGGRAPVPLPDGTSRAFLEDGDEVILRARAHRNGFVSIGFGECHARIIQAL